MSRKREISRRMATLGDISGIMSAMKSLALMEVHILGRFLQSQQIMLAGIEAAAADFLAWNEEFARLPRGLCELSVLVGSEQGFCGDFNEAVLRRAEEAAAEDPDHARWIVVGRRLASKCEGDPRVLLSLAGATVADEVPRVLLNLGEQVNQLLEARGMAGCGLSVLSHSDAAKALALRRLLPLSGAPPERPEGQAGTSDQPPPALTGAPKRRESHAPDIFLPPARFFGELMQHFVYATLNEALYGSLMAENRKRLTHMESAMNWLDDEMERLKLAYNAQRQEEIIEEIEILLLSAQALAGE